ncbi:hypothetical protein DB88DRAFT_513878 [Papiliotrema laurentii]|uniref:Uncharacterized protein n=1 Tax=Papiliotrema laurentii TaxID=5418 RepID=A0AAD9FIJ7_PAPLA|nr:hypothetical protein DB88DRAFT_513878 [Papiliotrema laurentii]
MTGPSIGHPNLAFGFLGFGRISQETVKRLLAFANKPQPPTSIYNSSPHQTQPAGDLRRDPIVNSEDLAWAVDQREIYGAGLDVITHEPNAGPDHSLRAQGEALEAEVP